VACHDFPAAVGAGLSGYARLSGRASRSEYWWFALFFVLACFGALLIDVVPGNDTGWLTMLVYLALLLPSQTVLVRRLHDTGRSGWWWWISFVPLGGSLVLFIFSVLDSRPGENRFGPCPKNWSHLRPGPELFTPPSV
jgi:uncharacterized membrane protein YhaH (DUF805 family)